MDCIGLFLHFFLGLIIGIIICGILFVLYAMWIVIMNDIETWRKQ